MSNGTTTQPPTLPPSIFLRTDSAPFLVFVILAIGLLLITLISIIVMMRQHAEHLRKMNALRGFHQSDVAAAKTALAEAGGGAGGGGGGAMSRSVTLDHSGVFATSQRRSSIGADWLDGADASSSSHRRGSISDGGGGDKHSGGSDGKKPDLAASKPYRLIYDLHSTPKQPALEAPAPAAAAERGARPAMPAALDIMNSAPSGSFAAASPNRQVGMSSFRKRN